MTAIVTNKFRVVNAENFKEDVTSVDNSVYVFIGKSDYWSDSLAVTVDSEAPIPKDNDRDLRLAYKDMIAGKLVGTSDVTHVLPRYDWTSGNSYVAWDDQDEQIFTKEFYVLTDERKVFKCLRVGPGASTSKPTAAQTAPFQTGDGYVWKYIYTLAIVDAEKFLTNFYMPVKTVVLAQGQVLGDLSESDQVQYTNQEDAKTNIKGKIYNIKVVTGGSGYTSPPLVTITGDGTGATATSTINGGAVTSITITNNGVTPYNVANVSFSGGGGTNATARAIVSPGEGHGTDPVRELGSSYIGVNVRLEYDEGSGDFIVDNDFRQIGLLKNPKDAGGTDLLTAPTFSALKWFQMASGSSFVAGDYVTGGTSGAKAYVDDWDEPLLKLKYHQNNKTGYIPFVPGETISGNSAGSGVISTLNVSEYTPQTGQIIFLENRAPINRSASQIEDVKIIIEF